ncbi:MAG TPA: flavin reductase family protein [Beijerinckiaceae bacterium]|nr:flavin reductase family protein [Beijerinckiaceae bacterium]
MGEETSAKVPLLSIEPKEFWRALSQRAIGVTIVTAQNANGPAGLLALSAAHVTDNPPTMLVSVDHRTSARITMIEAGHFAVNVLPRGSLNVANLFSGKQAVKGGDRFETGLWSAMKTGAPIFKNALAALDCVIEDMLERETCTIFFGRVVASTIQEENASPLVYFRGDYLTG